MSVKRARSAKGSHTTRARAESLEQAVVHATAAKGTGEAQRILVDADTGEEYVVSRAAGRELTLKPRKGSSTSARAIHEALERVEEARDALVHVGEEIRVRTVHEDASVAFGETLYQVLGDRPMSVQAARRAALAAAAGTVWEDAVGPLLTGEQVRELMNISRQRLSQLVNQGRLIVLEDRSGTRRYPAWQLDQDGRPLAALIAADQTLVEDGHMSGWSAASWCSHEHPELDDRSPRDWAAAGKDPERLALVARRDAARSAR